MRMTLDHAAWIAASTTIMEYNREKIREMSPEERRKFCRDMEAAGRNYGTRTGKFFNEIAGSTEPREEDEKELGRRIMARRNPNYRGESPDEERSNI